MILNFLLIMVVSALIFSLMIPPIHVENAKAQDFNDGGLPRATENAPIPYLIGRDRLNAPNTLYVGNYVVEARTHRVSSGFLGLGHTTVTDGYTYYITVDLGFCTGGAEGVTLHEIFIDDVSVWTGTQSTEGDITINAPSLFGGTGAGGGFVTSSARWFPGTFTQGKSALIESELADPTLLPNYNGIAHLVMRANIGESPQLRKIAIVASRMTNRLGIPDGKHIVETTGTNPAEALYTMMTDDWTGMGVDPALIDTDSLNAEALTYYTENNGCAGALYTQKDGKAFAQDIATQVDAIITIDPSVNKIILDSLRFDYDPDLISAYDEAEILSVESFSQTLWKDLVSEVDISYRDEDNLYAEATASDQDLAVAGITGRLKSTNISMPLVRKTTLATTLAGRELNQLSKPATSVVLIFNKKGYQLRPGSVFKWSWADYGITGMVLRVKKAEAGADDDGTIRIEATKDPYGEIYTTFGTPSVTPYDPLALMPDPVTELVTWDTHRLFVDYAGTIIASTNNHVSYMTLLAVAADTVSLSYSARINTVEDEAFSNTTFPSVGLLLDNITKTDGFATNKLSSFDVQIATIPDDWVNGDADSVRNGQNIIFIDDELMGFETYTDNLDGTVTLNNVHRALLNTVQTDHTASSSYVFTIANYSTISTAASLSTDSPVPVKILPSSGPYTLSPSEVTAFNVVVSGAYHRPEAPDYLTLESSRSLAQELSAGATATLDWYPRDKDIDAIRVADDAADTNPSGVTWSVYIYLLTDFVTPLYSATGLTSPTHDFTVPEGSSAANQTVEVRVYAVKSGLTSLVYDFIRFKVLAPYLLLSGDGEPDRLLLSGDEEPGIAQI